MRWRAAVLREGTGHGCQRLTASCLLPAPLLPDPTAAASSGSTTSCTAATCILRASKCPSRSKTSSQSGTRSCPRPVAQALEARWLCLREHEGAAGRAGGLAFGNARRSRSACLRRGCWGKMREGKQCDMGCPSRPPRPPWRLARVRLLERPRSRRSRHAVQYTHRTLAPAHHSAQPPPLHSPHVSQACPRPDQASPSPPTSA